MSLLINESYANPGKALWASSVSPVIDGNLIVHGNIHADGNTSTSGVVYQVAGATAGIITGITTPTYPNDGLAIQGDEIRFTKVGTGNTNTRLVTSAAGSGLDHFYTNFLDAVGPIPAAPIPNGAPQIVSLTPGSSTRVATFALGSPYPLVANAEYDVQAIGFITLSTTPAPTTGDIITIAVKTGTGPNTSVSQTFWPADQLPKLVAANDTISFNLRSRIVAPATPSANITATLNFSGAAGTGTIGGTITLLDVVRVA